MGRSLSLARRGTGDVIAVKFHCAARRRTVSRLPDGLVEVWRKLPTISISFLDRSLLVVELADGVAGEDEEGADAEGGAVGEEEAI
jgi:hypothetical protein